MGGGGGALGAGGGGGGGATTGAGGGWESNLPGGGFRGGIAVDLPSGPSAIEVPFSGFAEAKDGGLFPLSDALPRPKDF